MGTWGAKNFQNDTAGDFFLLFMERITFNIRLAILDPSKLYAGSYWSDIIPCIIDILTVLSEQNYHGGSLPEVQEIIEWKNIYMEVWRATIDETEPTQDYRMEREQELISTFDKLITQAEKNK